MKKYTIKTPFKALEYKRRDNAAQAFIHAAYDALRACSQLDTAAGKRIWHTCAKVAAEIDANVYPEAFSFSIALPHGAGNISFNL